MTMSSKAHLDASEEGVATFVSQQTKLARQTMAERAADAEVITDFNLAAGDKLDLSDVAAYFKFSPKQVQDALYYSEIPQGTEVGIEVDGVSHKIVVICGVTAATLCKQAPWVFDAGEAEVAGQSHDSAAGGQSDDGHGKSGTDEFVFDPASAVAPAPPSLPARPHDIAQLAEALGLSEQQVLDALRAKGFAPTGDPVADAAAASAVLADADALVL